MAIMYIKLAYFCLISLSFPLITLGISRCFMCRSRGELGSCKDYFNVNITLVTNKQENGVEAVPCASGWCGKIVESENEFKEEYGVATQRICLQRGPSDSEDRCAYTKWNNKRVYMCFCKGDLCNSSVMTKNSYFFMILMTGSVIFLRLSKLW